MSNLNRPSVEPDRSRENQKREALARRGVARAIGLGLITGAADDDPSAIGTYASAGAKFGPSFLWTAPALFPMMMTVVYLSSKLGLVSGRGLFAIIRQHYSRWFLFTVLTGVIIGNVIEAGADIGGMAAALNLFIRNPMGAIVLAVGLLILALQIWGSYTLIRNIFRVLSLALLAYIASAFLAHPEMGPILRGTFIPTIRFNKDFLAMIVATIGTSLSAYIYTWQSNEEVEEKIAAGRRRLWERRGTSRTELKQSMWDIVLGMFFASAVMYFAVLSTAATLFQGGQDRHQFGSRCGAGSATSCRQFGRPTVHVGDNRRWLPGRAGDDDRRCLRSVPKHGLEERAVSETRGSKEVLCRHRDLYLYRDWAKFLWD